MSLVSLQCHIGKPFLNSRSTSSERKKDVQRYPLLFAILRLVMSTRYPYDPSAVSSSCCIDKQFKSGTVSLPSTKDVKREFLYILYATRSQPGVDLYILPSFKQKAVYICPYTLIIPNLSTMPSSIDWYLKFPPSYLLHPSYYSHAQRKEKRKKETSHHARR